MPLIPLTVRQVDEKDIYKDLARIPEAYRRTTSGKPIEEGTICDVSTGDGKVTLSLRGLIGERERIIKMDEVTRNRLGVADNTCHHFNFSPAGYPGIIRWRWCASDSGQRLTNRMAIVGFGLTVTGALIAIGRLVIDLLRWAT